MKYNCLESINSMYIDKDDLGYLAIPCCLFKDRKQFYRVPNIKDLIDDPYLNEIRQGFKGDWKRPACVDCVMKEQSGVTSKRQRSLKRGDHGIRTWDIRPGNTCNLKCIMCNPWNSSKWHEDLDIFNMFSDIPAQKVSGTGRKDIDWDYIYENCVDKAHKIYIAGGEPFYMKQVQTFLERLSKSKFNCDHTHIQIQTNGVSNTPKLLQTLRKFKNLEFSISVDGWHRVNELIRFPTKHEEWKKHVFDLYKVTKNYKITFNVTVQALNLPNIDTLASNVNNLYKGKCTWNKLKNPSYLSINSLKPHIVEHFLDNTTIDEVKPYCDEYQYDEELNKKMQNFLLELDSKRGTNSKKILPWCFE